MGRGFAISGVLCWAVLISTPAYGASYYVATSGNDSNPGTIGHPWKTIQKAANTLMAGDTVYIKVGTYAERVIPQNSGAAGNYIIYTSYSTDTVTIDGTGIALPFDWGGLFDVSNKSYIKISGLRIVNAGPNDNNVGILVDNSSNITIEHNYTYNTTSSGIGVWGSDNITIGGNEVELANNDGEQESITVAGTDIFVIRNNHVHDGGPGTNGGEGIDAKDGASNGKIYNNLVHNQQGVCIYVDAWDKYTYNIEVFQNTVYNCRGDGLAVASEAGGLLENVKIYNNLSYNNQNVGISIAGWGEPVPTRPMKDITVINNTFYNNGQSWGGGISIENSDTQNLVIRNNIVSQNLSFQIVLEVPQQNMAIDYNLIDGYRGATGEIRGSNYVEGDPLFINSTSADFRLQATSPAIDQGSSTGAPNIDFDGLSRPQGIAYDIGAFEFVVADLNGDGRVDSRDLDIMMSRWRTGDAVTDLNRNGTVEAGDLQLLLQGWTH